LGEEFEKVPAAVSMIRVVRFAPALGWPRL
jgi:hypothetical protein